MIIYMMYEDFYMNEKNIWLDFIFEVFYMIKKDFDLLNMIIYDLKLYMIIYDFWSFLYDYIYIYIY